MFGHLAAGNDRLEEDHLVILDERHETGVTLDIDDEDALPRILLLIWVLNRVEQTAARQVENNVLERDAALLFKPFVLIDVLFVSLHDAKTSQRVRFGNSIFSTAERNC